MKKDTPPDPAALTGAPLLTQLKAIEDSRKAGVVTGFLVLPYAASCVIALAASCNDIERDQLLNQPIPNVVHTAVTALVGDEEVADRFVKAGYGQSNALAA